MEIFPKIEKGAIRSILNPEDGKNYYSIVDSVGIATNSIDARNYWKVHKSRLKKAQNKLVTECNQLKMRANDGKYYLTDVGDQETILKIVASISEAKVHLFEEYFNNLDQENLDPLPPPHYGGVASVDVIDTEKVSYPHNEEKEVENELQLLIDGYHTDDAIIIKAFVAGVNIENILITATTKSLTIKGERKLEVNNYKHDFLKQELYWGKFSRSIRLPYEIVVDAIEAQEKDGTLVIKLPLINQIHSKKIRIASI